LIDVDLAVVVVLNETEFPEFGHEKVYAGPGCANHLRQHLLGYFGKYPFRLPPRAITRKQQKSPRQTFFARVEELVDQVLLDSEVPGQYIGNETVGELAFVVQHLNHLVFLKDEHRRWRNRGR